MQELIKSLTEWFKEKTSSPLYIVFIVAFISWNWRVFYVLFFEKNLKNITSIEYAEHFSRIYWQVPYTGGITDLILHPFNWLIIVIFVFFIPAAVTYLLIWKLPVLSNFAHKISLSYDFERKKEFHKANTEYLEYVASQKTREAVAVTKQANAEKVIEKSLTQEERWRSEYSELEKNETFRKKFRQILDCVYERNGNIFSNGSIRRVDVDILTLAHIKELVEYEGEGKWTIALTSPKGRFFADLYIAREAEGFF